VQIEIEKINNSFENNVLSFFNFLQANEIFPQTKIREEYQSNENYNQILNSLAENYKSFCDAHVNSLNNPNYNSASLYKANVNKNCDLTQINDVKVINIVNILNIRTLFIPIFLFSKI